MNPKIYAIMSMYLITFTPFLLVTDIGNEYEYINWWNKICSKMYQHNIIMINYKIDGKYFYKIGEHAWTY